MGQSHDDYVHYEKLVALTEDGSIFVRDLAASSSSWMLLDPPMLDRNVYDYHESVPEDMRNPWIVKHNPRRNNWRGCFICFTQCISTATHENIYDVFKNISIEFKLGASKQKLNNS